MLKKTDAEVEVFTVGELMEVLNIGRNTAYKLLKEGTIKSFRFGKRYIIPKQSVVLFLKTIVENDSDRK